MGVCRPVPLILTLLRTKKCHFHIRFQPKTSKIHTRFQTNPLGRKYVIKVLRLEGNQKSSSNPVRIRLFLFLSYSFGIETINTLIHCLVFPLKTIPHSRTKWAKSIPVFSPKRRINSTRCGTAHTFMAYIKEYPPPPPPRVKGLENEVVWESEQSEPFIIANCGL